MGANGRARFRPNGVFAKAIRLGGSLALPEWRVKTGTAAFVVPSRA